MKQPVQPIIENHDVQGDQLKNRSGLLSEELLEAISMMPMCEVYLYQKVSDEKNIVPFRRNYQEAWEGLAVAQMLQKNCMNKIKAGQYPQNTFSIEISDMREDKFYFWSSSFGSMRFEVEKMGGDDIED
jgi:hypothetical protein